MQIVSVDKDFFAKCKKYGTDRELKCTQKSVFSFTSKWVYAAGKKTRSALY